MSTPTDNNPTPTTLSPGEVKSAYCVPVDQNGMEEENIAVLEVPLEGKYSVNKAANSMIRTVLNFVGFAMIVGIVMLGTPLLYKLCLTKLISDNFTSYPLHFPTKADALKSAEIFISIILCILIGSYIGEGVASSDSSFIVAGAISAIMIVIAVARIQIAKMDESAFFKEYMDDASLKFGEFKPDMLVNFYSGIKTHWVQYIVGLLLTIGVNVGMFGPWSGIPASASIILTTIFGGLYLSTFFAYIKQSNPPTTSSST